MRWAGRLVPFLILLLATAQIGTLLHWWGSERPGIAIGGPFRLDASDGRTVTERSFAGRWMLVYFGYTHCPDFCPATLDQIGRALRDLGPDAERVAPLFVTVDPLRDTVPVLRAYVAQFDPRIIGLTGSAAEIAGIEHAYHVMAPAPDATHPDLERIEHSAAIFVMDPNDRLAAVIPGDAGADAISQRLRRLIR